MTQERTSVRLKERYLNQEVFLDVCLADSHHQGSLKRLFFHIEIAKNCEIDEG